MKLLQPPPPAALCAALLAVWTVHLSEASLSRWDRANWMSRLSTEDQLKPITRLSIPGTHNSGTYSLRNRLAADMPSGLQKWFNILKSFLYKVVKDWSRCQDINIEQQLRRGVRYLDLRVSKQSSDPRDLHISHGLEGPPLRTILAQIAKFLRNHKGEIVILDFQHFYGGADVSVVQTMLSETGVGIARQMLSNGQTRRPSELSVKKLLEEGAQIVAIFPPGITAGGINMAPTRANIDRIWPNTMKTAKAIDRLTTGVNRDRSTDTFVVCQGVLTPNFKDELTLLVKHADSSLRNIAQRFNPHFKKFLREDRQRGNWTPYISICDFIDQKLIDDVISVNELD